MWSRLSRPTPSACSSKMVVRGPAPQLACAVHFAGAVVAVVVVIIVSPSSVLIVRPHDTAAREGSEGCAAW